MSMTNSNETIRDRTPDLTACSSVPQQSAPLTSRADSRGCKETQHIQGDSGGIYNTLGNDSMCDSKQKKFI